MARGEAYRLAERKIDEALGSDGKHLDLSVRWGQDQRLTLTELPESLVQLAELRSLDLYGNDLVQLPEWLGSLRDLQFLYLSRNKLVELPDSLLNLQKLTCLSIDNNRLTSLPELSGRLRQLRELRIQGNDIDLLHEWLNGLVSLVALSVDSKQVNAFECPNDCLTHIEDLELYGASSVSLPAWLGGLGQLKQLRLTSVQMKVLPEWLCNLKQLSRLLLSHNGLKSVPDWIGKLPLLEELMVFGNQLTEMPGGINSAQNLKVLSLTNNRLKEFPSSILSLVNLQELYLAGNQIISVPDDIGRMVGLRKMVLGGSNISKNHVYAEESSLKNGNKVANLPSSLLNLKGLLELKLEDNPLVPELGAAYKEGLEAVKRYLRSKADAHVVLNEAKLILIGEGEVGKSCLLGALRGDPWEEGRPTTHGIEIKPVKVNDPATGTEITLNGWDFGGQRVYRPTHQLFFSAPAVYLVVWKPREGPQQDFVKEWIKLVKHREPDAKILVVATHGGPNLEARQPDIDRQKIWDLFGKDTVVDFFFVESKPPSYDHVANTWVGERAGIKELRDAIARVAASLPEVGRSVPRRWAETRIALKDNGAAYLPLEKVLKLCQELKMDDEEAKDFVRVAHRLGHLIHYEHDPALRDIVVLKPDWLSTAMSYVLDDKQTRDNHGLVEFSRLSKLWNDPLRPTESQYEPSLHPLFLRLMERFDISYKVAVPNEPENALGFWQRIASSIGISTKQLGNMHYTSLIAQLVPDIRPNDVEFGEGWPANPPVGDNQRVQICRIVETKSGQSANAEGLFYQLMVRLHKYSLGRVNYRNSIQWQRGLVLDDDYNGRALLEHIGNDVRITVRAAYPEGFLAVLTREVKYLVESFWAGLRCDVMVPCISPCGRDSPGTGLFEVQKLIQSKRSGRPEYPCPVCDSWQNIDCLLRNAPAARPAPLELLLSEFDMVRVEITEARQQLMALRGDAMGRFDRLDSGTKRILGRVEDGYASLMQALTDEAKEGPRLFSIEPVDPGFFDRPKWVSEKFRVTLWCEHSRLSLPALNGKKDKRGVYEIKVPRDWFVKAAPFLKVLASTLSLVVPVASSATKFALDEASYKAIEDQLDLGQKSIESVVKAGDQVGDWLGREDGHELESTDLVRAQGAILRQLHAWLKEKDPSFGGLVRVQNKRHEFLWVHPQFESEY